LSLHVFKQNCDKHTNKQKVNKTCDKKDLEARISQKHTSITTLADQSHPLLKDLSNGVHGKTWHPLEVT
jgi:hypothetical protein